LNYVTLLFVETEVLKKKEIAQAENRERENLRGTIEEFIEAFQR
jgi:hypothetical protein